MLGRCCPNPNERIKLWYLLWSSKVIPKIKYFIWILFHGIIPTAVILRNRDIELDTICRVCRGIEESVSHLFFDCVYAQEVWNLVMAFAAQILIDVGCRENWDDVLIELD